MTTMGCFFIFVREIFKSVYHWFLLIPLFLLQERPQFQTIYTSWTAVSVGRFCFLGYAGGSTCLTQQVVLEPIGSDLSFCIDKGFLGSGFWQYLRLLNILANLTLSRGHHSVLAISSTVTYVKLIFGWYLTNSANCHRLFSAGNFCVRSAFFDLPTL